MSIPAVPELSKPSGQTRHARHFGVLRDAPEEIGALPLLGRDVYAMLVSLPRRRRRTAQRRGLGISVAGQRPVLDYLPVDGVENNNYLVTGPLNPVSPEAMQEYRISTNNYSAEYGRTAGFIANAVTRAGTDSTTGSVRIPEK